MTNQVIHAMTRSDVSKFRPCKDDFRQANNVLPNWVNTAYTPTEMAEYGVKHSSIMWAWLRNEVLGRKWLVEATRRMAEEELPIFETINPDDKCPRNAIEAARTAVNDPTKENKAAANTAADVNYANNDAVDAEAAYAAYATDATVAAASNAAAYINAAYAAAERRQIDILEYVIVKASQ